MVVEFFDAPVKRVTDEPKYHFFGYYDKSPWDIRDHYILSLQTSFEDRPPRPEDEAVIGILDPEDDYAFKTLATTHAWNWQQGCMLQWIPNSESKIIFNDREDGRYLMIVKMEDMSRLYSILKVETHINLKCQSMRLVMMAVKP